MKKIFSNILLGSFLLISCNKKDSSDFGPITPPSLPPVTSASPKKFLVDSTKSTFLSTPQDIINGNFKYNSLPGVDSMMKGDFFIEPRDYGYLRRIESITKSNGEVIVATTQGTLSEFYLDSGYIKRNFSIPLSENPFARMSTNASTLASFPTIDLSGQGWSLSLQKLKFSFDPNWIYEFDVKNGYLKAGFENAQTKLEYDVSVTADFTGKAETEFKLSSIFPISKILKIHIPNLFMQVHVVDFIVKVTLEGGGKLEPQFHYKNHTVTNAYLEYKNSALGGVYNTVNPVYENTKNMSVTGGMNVKIEMYPIIRIRQFGIPIINFGVMGVFETDVRHSLVFDVWDLEMQRYGGFFGNFNKTMFKFVAPEEFFIKSPSIIITKTPKTLKYLSGGNETPIINAALKNPIEFQVFEDSIKTTPNPEAFVNVFFSSNYGKWTQAKVRTGIDGKVKNTFTMGPEEKEHILTATIKNAANTVIDTKIIKISPKEPASVSIVSGNNQTGSSNTNLQNPLIVLVKDKDGFLMLGVNVTWVVTVGGGQVTSTTTTGSDGKTSNSWKLGASGNQTVTATVKKNDGTNVTGSPLTFTANSYNFIGSWKLVSFANGVAPGSFVNETASGCPNIITLKYSLLVDNYTIGANTFTNFNRERIIHYQLGIQNCVIVNDGADTDITYDETLNGTYTLSISGNTVTYQTTAGSKTFSFQFLTPDRVKVGENEYIRL